MAIPSILNFNKSISQLFCDKYHVIISGHCVKEEYKQKTQKIKAFENLKPCSCNMHIQSRETFCIYGEKMFVPSTS